MNTTKYPEDYYIGNSMKETLAYEKSTQPFADAFYKKVFKADEIIRYNWDSPIGRGKQKQDIDCSIKSRAAGVDDYEFNISEKFRTIETGDMCIELWSDFDKKKPGWAVKNNTYQIDLYFYTTPKYCFTIWNNSSFQNMINHIIKEWNYEKIKNIFGDGSSYNCNKKVKVCGFDVTLLKTWTENKYYGICICIPWKTLFQEFLLNINMFDHNGNKLKINEIYK